MVKIAKKLNRIIITKNVRDIKKLGEKYCVDVVGVTETVSPGKLDKQIMAMLRKRKQKSMSGSFIKIVEK